MALVNQLIADTSKLKALFDRLENAVQAIEISEEAAQAFLDEFNALVEDNKFACQTEPAFSEGTITIAFEPSEELVALMRKHGIEGAA